jgi:uncharacterized repeat protein (TIGR03803 family)
MKRIVSALGKLNRGRRAYGVLLLCVATRIASAAQSFTTLHSFDYKVDGDGPVAALVQGTDGNFYGTTWGSGGAHLGGTVFKITPSGTLTTLYNFCSRPVCADGEYPAAGLIQATDGNFYGTTEQGGASGDGTVFKITPSGTLTTLHSFDGTDGAYPLYEGLIQATNGSFYGTTSYGGASYLGTVFKITASGTLTTLYNFCSQSGCTDGANPDAGLVQATDGSFYGTTYFGGFSLSSCYGPPPQCGTVFKITPSGTLTTLHRFDGADGANPIAGLVQATNGSFYGTTYYGGASYLGTVFKITASGTLTTLHSFDGTDGANPSAGLVQGTNRNFYGTSQFSDVHDGGTVFKITPSGTLTTLYNFPANIFPAAGLVQGTNGNFYGTTLLGGVHDTCPGRRGTHQTCGTVFRLSLGLGPFVETRPTSGKVGAAVKILGTKLTGATSVKFNGTAAVFVVKSSSLITTTVPEDGTTGTVEVTTPKGTLKSNGVFRVTK